MSSVLEALRKVSLFSDFPDEALEVISRKVESLSLPANTYLFKAGDDGDAMYIIVHGQISILGLDDLGQEVLFGELTPGEYFGEMSLLEKKPRSASARTISRCELLKLDQPDFLDVLDQYPRLAVKLASGFSARLRSSSEILEHLSTPEKQAITEGPAEQRIRVFISYSRRDKDFVRKLHDGLVANGVETWVDWEGIPLGTDWWQEIVEGIQSCDSFLFVISPDSVISEVCADELQIATDNNKRLVPVLFREEKDTVSQMREELQAINFTFMRTDQEFDELLPELISTLSTDVEYVKAHTRLQNIALEWDRKKRSSSLTLRGEELENAESWLAHTGGRHPPPSALQGEFIQASRKDANRRQQQFLTGVVAALIITIILAVLAAFSYVQAENSRKLAVTAEAEAAISRDIARDNEAFAQVQRATAEAASTEAINQQAIAFREATAASAAEATAIAQKVVADEQRSIANEQREIADAQRLASQAEGDLSRGYLLTRSLLLAISSMQKSRNYQADLALRIGLDIMPSLLHREEFEAPITKVVYSLDGMWLAIAEQNGHIEVWDSIYGDIVAQMSHDALITDMVFTPDGTKLATAGDDSTVRVWDPATGEELFRLQHEGPVRALAISVNGYWLASGGDDQIARTWNLRTGRQVASVYHTGTVNDIDFSPGGSWVASVGSDRAAILWVPTTGEVTYTIYHDTEVQMVLFGPGSLWMATASKGGTVSIWNPQNGAHYAQLSHEQDITAMDFSKDGQWLVTASLDRTARVWEPVTGRSLTQLRHDRQVLSVSFSSNGQWVATGSSDDTARVWEPLTGREIARMEHNGPVSTMAFTPNGLLLTTGSQDSSVRVWSPEAVGQAILSLKHPAPVIDLDFNPDETLLATAGGDRTIRIWEMATASVILTIPLDDEIVDVDFSRDGNHIATAGADGFARIWDASTGVEVTRFEHEGDVLDVDFSRDGQWLVTGSADGTARIWLIETGELLHIYNHGGAVGEVSLRADGRQMATASLDRTTRIWDIASDTEFRRLEHPAGVILVNFVAETNWVVTVSQDNVVRFWDDVSGELIDRFFVDNQIRAIEISSDGTKLAMTGEDNIARVWEIVSLGESISLQEVSRVIHLGIINDVVFGADGAQIATASNDRTVLISLLIPEELIDKACHRVTRNLTQLEWSQFFESDVYRLTCENLPPDPRAISNLKSEIGRLGAQGDYTSAVAMMRHIQTLDPSTVLDIAAEIRNLTIFEILNNAVTFAQEGRFEEAYQNYLRLLSFDGFDNHPARMDLLINLCYAGANEEGAERVLSLCEEALVANPENRPLYEARAIVRAWMNDFDGAKEDLDRAINLVEGENISNEEREILIQEREEWIQNLEAGTNPFLEIPPS